VPFVDRFRFANGLRLASDRQFVAALGEHNRPGRRVNVYLQFDGFEQRTHREIRGRDLREIKQRALDNCAEAGLTVTLVAAVERGLNDHELGAIVRHGLTHVAVRSVAFQPVRHSGRHLEFDPLTPADQLRRQRAAGRATPGVAHVGRLLPGAVLLPHLPLHHLPAHRRHARHTGLRVGADPPAAQRRGLPRLRHQPRRARLTRSGRPLEKLWSASAFMGTATTEEKLAVTAAALDCGDACGINLPKAVKDLPRIQDLQDPYTLNVKQLMNCCVEEITPDGRLIPFCAYNSVGYRGQLREQMSGVSVADVVPNALPLQPLLTDSPYGSRVARRESGTGPRAGRDQTNVGRRLR
jgi:hypothetical protein